MTEDEKDMRIADLEEEVERLKRSIDIIAAEMFARRRLPVSAGDDPVQAIVAGYKAAEEEVAMRKREMSKANSLIHRALDHLV